MNARTRMTSHQSVPVTRDAYNDWHARQHVDAEANAPWHELIRRYLVPERDLAGRRVLEIGCGLGGLSCWLARHPSRPREILAADFSPVAVARAQEFAAGQQIGNITWLVADIQDLSSLDTEFDTVFSCETIEHVPDPPRAVRQLARVLKPGGRLFLTTPNYLSMMGLYRVYCWARGKPFDEGGQPLCQLTLLLKTQAWVRRAGLSLVVSESAGQYLPFPRRAPILLPWLDQPHWLMKWFGLHSLIVANKPE